MTDFAAQRLQMVDNQLRTSAINDHRVLQAMGTIPRERFVPAGRESLAYADVVHDLGRGRFLASPAPFARMLQLAAVEHEDHVLDVGVGTGYSTAILAALAHKVTGIESDPDLAAAARANLVALGVANASVLDAPLDGTAPAHVEFDLILVEGAVSSEPSGFFHRLKDGGRLVALVRTGVAAVATVYVRAGSEIAGRTEFNTTLPPLPTAPKPEAFVF